MAVTTRWTTLRSASVPESDQRDETNLNLLQDSVSENPAETIIIDIASVSGGDSASENGTQSRTVTITDDGGNEQPQISLAGNTDPDSDLGPSC